MHKYRSSAKRAAWYDEPDEVPSYNPFKKVRARTGNPGDLENTLHQAQTEDNVVRRSRGHDQGSQEKEHYRHANTMPASASGAIDSPQSNGDLDIARSSGDKTIAADKSMDEAIPEVNPESTEENVASASDKTAVRQRKGHGFLSRVMNNEKESEEEDDKSKEPNQKFTPMSQVRATLFNSWINILLLAAPVGIAVNYIDIDPIAVFVINFIAIIPLAALLSYATEEIALRTGETLGGLLNASFGNAVELIVSIIALSHDEVLIVKTSLIGSMLSNLLLVMGMCFFFGGLNRIEQNFNVVVAQTASSLLFLAVGSLIIPTAFHSWSDAGDRGVAPLSHGTSVILLVVYGCYLFFQLKSHAEVYNRPSEKVEKRKTKPEKGDVTLGLAKMGGGLSAAGAESSQNAGFKVPDEEEEPQLHIWVAIGTLTASTVVVALCAEFMVDSIDDITEDGGISKTFVGLILLPIVGNAAEHATAVTVAIKDKMDLAIGVAVGSSMQIALLVLPFSVVLGWIMGKDDMTLNFDGFQIAVLFVAVLLVNYLIQDGKSHWLEGVLLMTLYLIISVAAWFYPTHDSEANE